MLNVISLEQAQAMLKEKFQIKTDTELLELSDSAGRTLAEDIESAEFVPDFSRSTVDGYAVRAADTFGCSEAIPAMLKLKGEVLMGQSAAFSLGAGECAAVPTGGALPAGADAMVMLEYAEDFGGGTIAVQKPSAPGAHIIFRGDDVKAGQKVLKRGCQIQPKDIGALAAMGVCRVPVFKKPKVAVLSTGNEIVSAETKCLSVGQMRDVNGPMLASAVASAGGEPLYFGIVKDEPELLKKALIEASSAADMVRISGGSSVGARDAAALVLGELGKLLFHGLALKPGKPTLAAELGGKPVLGLPGHPVAAYFIFSLLVRPLLFSMLCAESQPRTLAAVCQTAIPSSHGREECVAVRCENGVAVPVIGKSGLITTLAGADGYIRIPRDAEGIARGESVTVYLF